MATQGVGGTTNRSGLTIAQQSIQDAIKGLDQNMQMFNNLPFLAMGRNAGQVPTQLLMMGYPQTQRTAQNQEQTNAAIRYGRARLGQYRNFGWVNDLPDPAVEIAQANKRAQAQVQQTQVSSNLQGSIQNITNMLNALVQAIMGNPAILQALVQGRVQGAGTTTASSNRKEVKDGEVTFATMDADGKDGISEEEFITAYIRNAEKALGRQIKRGEPDFLKYEAEAKNLFSAISINGSISKDRYMKYLNTFDRADGAKDGIYDADYKARILETIKREGNVEISAGKTLSQLIDMEG